MTEDPPVRGGARTGRERLHEVIFEADTRAGKLFDVVLLVVIAASVLAVVLDSVESISSRYHDALIRAEWIFTLIFTLEYILRLYSVRRKLGYALSFFGVIDFLAIVPTWLTLIAPGWHGAMVVRALRLLRVFRIFKLAQFLTEAQELRAALRASRAKITVFLTTVLIVICIVGSLMHVIEGPESGFTSIPQGIYWAVVTVTTVGYGDISPESPLGKAVAAGVMILGYSLLLIPGSIISAEWIAHRAGPVSTQVCPDCSREGHAADAIHCKYCGGRL